MDANKIVDKATEEELVELIRVANDRLNEFKMERASTITLGSIVSYGGGKQAKVVMIFQDGVIVTSEELKKKKTLKWNQIE